MLEIGFGNGAFAAWLKSNHPAASWTGIEIQDELIDKARAAGFNAFKDLNYQIEKESVDVIVAFDVLEHLSDRDIKDLFDRLRFILSPKGIILARTPNGAGPFGLPNQTGDPTHMTPINANRLSSYLPFWTISEYGDMKPLWEGRPLSFVRNFIRSFVRWLIKSVIRFAFAPQPKSILSANLHLIFHRSNLSSERD